MEIQPLTKELYNKCVENKISKFVLRFSGGNDEGYLDIDIESEHFDYDDKIYRLIESWAWDVYTYYGAGDGNDYGDNISYDIENKSTTHEEWYTQVKHEDEQKFNLEIKD